jgi:hypothetical protein
MSWALHNMHPFGRQGNTIRTLFNIRGKSEILCRHELERQLATVWTLGQHLPDAVLIRKRVKRVMEVGYNLLSGRSMLTSKRRLEKSESVLI